jgi:hypothetical protein
MGSQNVAAATLSVDGATATSDAGRVSEIYVKDIEGTLKWDGANSSPGDTTVKLEAKRKGSDNDKTVLKKLKFEGLSGLSGSKDYDFGEVSILGDLGGSDKFTNDTRDEGKTTTVVFQVEVNFNNLRSGSGLTVSSPEAEADITINDQNVSGAAGAGGDGEVVIEVPNGKNSNQGNGN